MGQQLCAHLQDGIHKVAQVVGLEEKPLPTKVDEDVKNIADRAQDRHEGAMASSRDYAQEGSYQGAKEGSHEGAKEGAREVQYFDFGTKN